jgi:hypothetical protein
MRAHIDVSVEAWWMSSCRDVTTAGAVVAAAAALEMPAVQLAYRAA